ncbi:MAG TPA: hypothetical protein PLR57_05930, partial [Clostridia bacterium]|nr:hypothetical protein [Clostridia bacterium]
SLNPPGKFILPLWLFYGNHVFDTPARNRCKKYLRQIKLKSEEPCRVVVFWSSGKTILETRLFRYISVILSL